MAITASAPKPFPKSQKGSSKNQAFSRAYLKLKGFVDSFPEARQLFLRAEVLDVGSSTGGFTKISLELGVDSVTAVELGTRQMRQDLALNPRVKLHEKTDILDVSTRPNSKLKISPPDLILIDASFTSAKPILRHLKLSGLISPARTKVILLLKPQFEASPAQLSSGIVKNGTIRRLIIRDFEEWLKFNSFGTLAKRDSSLPGSKGNLERLYLLAV